ncbi:MAG: ATP-binding protein [Deltaproteobacteria bacterium]|nr:ATP-binding protein [Deltaproteobacteria bacterium]
MKRTRSTFFAHPGVDPKCRRCRGQSYLVEPQGEHAVAQLCGCVRPCPECRGSGFVARSEGLRAPLVRCRCTTMVERTRRFNLAVVPARHAHSTLVSFDPSDKKVTLAFAQVNKYIQAFMPTGENRGLVLHGEVGRGKTHLMVATLRELVFRYGASARFVEFSHLIADLKSSFDRGGGTSALLDPLTRVRVLAIDEIGKGRNTEWEGTVLDELISRRYNAAATIIGTSNYGPGPAKGLVAANLAKVDGPNRAEQIPALVDRVGERVYSRLEEMCDFQALKGPDYRLRNRPWTR